MRSLVERAHFLKNALSDRKIGAVTMSSDYVIADVLRRLPKNPRLVIEYGPGEGAVTRAILGVLPPDARLVVIEPNQEFLDALGKITDPRLTIVSGMAQNLSHEALAKMRGADAIVASMPFSFLAPAERSKVVSDAYDLLAPGGNFIISHQYSWIMRKPLRQKFPSVSVFFEPRNIFPCFILNARKL